MFQRQLASASASASVALPLADLSHCDQEPIHIPGHIQPQGALLAIRREDFVVVQASANLGLILGLSAKMSLGLPLHEVLGRPLQELLGDEARAALEDFVSRNSYAPHDVLQMDGVEGVHLNLRAHRTGNLICAELEPVSRPKPTERSSITLAQSIISRLSSAKDQQDLCAAAASEFKALAGYDRVMVYRFDEDGHGEVIAEARESTLPPYLGLHYPATDIPQQARRLFMEQRVRLIGDMHYIPVPIVTHANLHDGVPLDMTHSALRGVSPIHIEYLNNMGVRASFGVSLANSGQLWGLIVGHHGSPRWMDTEQRAAVDIIGQILSSLLLGLDLAALDARAITTSKMMRSIGDGLLASSLASAALAASQDDLLDAMNAGGAMLRINGNISVLGAAPPVEDAASALSLLYAAAAGETLATSELGLQHAELASCTAHGSGAFLLPLSETTTDAILWFRPEVLQTVTWGGNPNKPSEPDELTGRLTPRKSFDAWKEIVRGRSLPWRQADFAIARELRRLMEASAKVHYQDEIRRAAAETSSLVAVANLQLIADSRAELARSLAETQVSVAALIASSVTLASSREQAKMGLADLRASELALASLQAKTKVGVADLIKSEVLNKALRFANSVLISSQDAMRESEERFHFATQAGRLGVWELDLSSGNLTATNTCKENFGRTSNDSFTFDQLRRAIRSDKDDTGAVVDNAVVTGSGFDIECKIDRPDGEQGWVKLKAQVARDPSGVPFKIAGISLDITERVLTQERMRQSQRIEAIGQLTAGVAHDFNNVLQSLLGGIELAIDELEDRPDVRSDLELALQSGQRGARLTSHLLSFSRQQMLRPEAVRLPGLLKDLSRILSRTLGRHIAVEVEIQNDLPDVLADPAHLDSALLNLALNARDAMPQGGQLRIQVHAKGNEVIIQVLDTGEGMAPEVLAKACEPFFSTKGLKGSGLGLSMVQGFARQSGGELSIHSVPGGGTQVQISLPVVPTAAPSRLSAAPQTIRGHGRILVVDDEADVGRVTAAFLKRAGYDVVMANGGNEALLALGVGPEFDALVADYAMPGMNGVDLVGIARELYPVLPALIITGYAGAEGLETLPANVDLLRKPFQREVLARKVKDLVEGVALSKAGP